VPRSAPAAGDPSPRRQASSSRVPRSAAPSSAIAWLDGLDVGELGRSPALAVDRFDCPPSGIQSLCSRPRHSRFPEVLAKTRAECPAGVSDDDLGSRRTDHRHRRLLRARREGAGRNRPQSSDRASRRCLDFLACSLTSSPVYWLASAHRAQSSNAALPSVGEVTSVGSTITLPRSGYMLGMAVQVNEVDAEPSSS